MINHITGAVKTPQRLKFVDLCAGIGGFRLGFERAGMKCVGYCEIDRFARQAYEAMYDTAGEWTAKDITMVADEDIDKLQGVDAVCGGFPCQPFSIAGKRKGFSDDRGQIIFSIFRFIRKLRPRWFVLENVRGLLSIEGGRTFNFILRSFSDMGYDCEWAVLNSKDFGVPQNRERLYIIGHPGEGSPRAVLPIEGAGGEAAAGLQEITHGESDSRRVYSVDGCARTLKSEGGGWGAKTGLYAIPQTIATVQHVGKEYQGVRNVGVDTAQAVTASYKKGCMSDGKNCVINGPYRVRRLTPKECWRLQGFPDELFERAKSAGLSDTQLYKQAGNAVTVNVTEWIGRILVSESGRQEWKRNG